MKSVRGVRFAAVAAVAAVAFGGVSAFAETETLTVADDVSVNLTSTTVLTGSTRTQDAVYPLFAAGQPSFWLDCSDTTGWLFKEGTQQVTNVPSKAGSKLHGLRYLANNLSSGDWTGWSATSKPKPPTLTTGPALIGNGKYLDFGDAGSQTALLFNTDDDGYNALRDIGTVIAVWGSDVRNGGHLLGGGATKDYGWHRAGNPVTGSSVNTASYRWWNCIMNGNAQGSVFCGYLWQDGILCSPALAGYNASWEVLSLQCTNALAEACGIGVNDKRSAMSYVSGGQEVAELLIYDTVLTREQIEQVEMYLEQKWFGRNRTGWNGEARVGTVKAVAGSVATAVDTAAGETLEIDRVIGGDQKASITKTGAGKLVFAGSGAEDYGGELILQEGVLDFPAQQAAPTAETLPPHLYARFDASEPDSMEFAPGTSDLRTWSNLSTADNAYIFKRRFCLRPRKTSQCPQLIPDALGPGLNVLDFGANKTLSDSGIQMVFSTNETENATQNDPVSAYGISTVVAFMGAHRGGGNLFNSRSFMRANVDTKDFQNSVYYHQVRVNKDINARSQKRWTDGRLSDPKGGYETPCYQVVAFQTVGGSVSRFLTEENGSWSGGARIGEVLIWNRVLTESEILAAQAYLEAKWLKRAVPGYARPAGAFVAADVQRLMVPADCRAEINVGAGRTVRIASLKALGELVKTGDGDLEIEKAEFPYGTGKVTVQGGTAKVIGVRDVASATTYAPGASLHLDATEAKTMDIVKWTTGDNSDRVALWESRDGGVALRNSDVPSLSYVSRAPYLVGNACNGLPVVDFGRATDSTSKTNDACGGCYGYLTKTLHSMKSVYAVVSYRCENFSNGKRVGFLFSNRAGSPINEADSIAFHPGLADNKWNGRFMSGYPEQTAAFPGGAGVYTNGVATGAYNFLVPSNEFFLVELHAAVPLQAGEMGCDRSNLGDRLGGFRVGEVIVYERELSDREKVATRNYLMRKWFDPDYEDPLPPAPEKTKLVERTIEVDGEQTRDFAEDADLATLSGEGTFTKTGAGALSFFDISGFSGTVNVAEGSFAVKGADLEDAGELVTDGIVYHADATKGVTTTLNEAHNAICVSEWASQTENGYTAVRSGADVWNQSLVYDPDLAYKPTVDMMGYNACFRWQDKDGNWLNIGGIKSVFWLIGSQNGGGFLLGGGRNTPDGDMWYYWHRGIYYPNGSGTTPALVGTTNLCAILHGGADTKLKNATWHLNGTKIGYGTGLSGKWDVLSMVVKDDESAVNADGLAFDGRSRKASGATNHEYNGHQRLAEVIVYDRRVSDEERVRIENYLRSKWLFGVHPAAENVTVNVAADASLVLGGAQRFAGLTGAGTVEGDISAMRLVADGAATAWPTVNGTFTIPEGVTVDFSNVDASTLPVEVKILTATSVAGYEFAKNVSYTGVTLGAGDKVNLRFRNGALSAVIKPGGSLILVR